MNENSTTKHNFYGYEFLITPDVLIPRPETEQLIDMVLSLAGISYLPGVKPTKRTLPNPVNILDVGTGSGCIAITLALKLKNAKISACDISTSALEVAKKNTQSLNANVIFLESNLLENISQKPDLIVANLPYVDKDWPWLDKKALSIEPSVALYADDHGLEMIKKLINQASKRLIKDLIHEADPCEHQDIIEYAKKTGFLFKEARGFILYFTLCKHQV